MGWFAKLGVRERPPQYVHEGCVPRARFDLYERALTVAIADQEAVRIVLVRLAGSWPHLTTLEDVARELAGWGA